MKLLVATRKGLFQLGRSSSGWKVESIAFLGAPVTAVAQAGGDLFAAVGHGHFGAKLHRLRDGRWEEVAVPKWPEKPAGPPEKDTMGRVIPWSLEQIWCLEASGGTLFCGTLPGGLFRSGDAGASWTMIRSLWDREERREWFGGGYDFPGIHSIALDGRRVLAAVSCGGVWASEDSGENWELRGKGLYAAFMPPERKFDQRIQDVHRLARCAAAPEVVWVQHHNGAFRSTDAGRNFAEIQVPPSSFGFAVAAHPRDPQTAWFVPAHSDQKRAPIDGKMVVTRTRDGGKTFEILKKGLPQEHAYDLVLRHAFAISGDGKELAFGSSTGNLWITENQGDEWHTVAQHLPPIYAVRHV